MSPESNHIYDSDTHAGKRNQVMYILSNNRNK